MKKLNGRSKSSKKLAVISDLHVGQIRSLGIETINKEQEALGMWWAHCIDEIGYVNLLLLNGEPIQGENTKELGNENKTSNITYQIAEAVTLVKMWNYAHLFVTRGSKYHSARNQTCYEEMFAREIKADNYTETKDYTAWWVNFYIHDKLFNACHHIRIAKVFFYLTTPLQREMGEMHFAKGKYYGVNEHIDCYIRAHAHRALMIRHPNEFGFQTGCWQFPNDFLMRGGLGGTFPSIGCASVIVEPNGETIYQEYIMPNDMIPKVKPLRI